MDRGRAVTGRTRRTCAIVAAALAMIIGGCAPVASPADKAGAPAEAPIKLVLGTPDPEGPPGTGALRHFAAEVASRSGGRITIEISFKAGGDAPETEAIVIDRVREGSLDLGWVGTRAWDGQGIDAFAALQTPFLIRDYGVMNAVMASEVPARMLGELGGVGLSGLGMYPDQLRHPLGFREPFLTLDDFDGATLRVPASRLSDEIIRSLGATPAHLDGQAAGDAIASGEVVGAETSIGNAAAFPAGSFLTMNVTFYPKFFSLFATSERLGALSPTTRALLEAAADETLAYVLAEDPEAADIAAFCAIGGVLVNAKPAALERIVAAADPIRQSLMADPDVAGYMSSIEELAGVSTAPPLTVCPA